MELCTLQLSFRHAPPELVEDYGGGACAGAEGVDLRPPLNTPHPTSASALTRLLRPALLALLRGVMSAPRLGFLVCPGPGAAGASACSSAVSSCRASLQGSSLTFGVDPMSCFMRASICRRAAQQCKTLHGCQL